jgi:hypothetical protein
MTPQEYQAITWSGLRNMSTPKYTSSKPRIEHVNESIERTARLTGLSREEVLKHKVSSDRKFRSIRWRAAWRCQPSAASPGRTITSD